MRYEPHRLRVTLEKLRRPLDARFNRALDEILLVIDPFEELETWVVKRYKELEGRVTALEDGLERQATEEIQAPEEVS